MKTSALLAVLLLGVTTNALALGCDVKEYAQYKDQLRTREGRNQLAVDYCLNAQLKEIREQYTDACRREMSKQIDALKSVQATAAINWALRGCPGNGPK